jgi:hypothetical protein
MPDLQPNTPAPATDDPLAKLHKMSTTAGLGSGDYVAVNITAVVCFLFGAASLLARLSNALLVIPLIGVICGILAMRQIRRSNGTQTGQGVAAIGLLLSLGIGGWVITSQVHDYLSTREDEQQIAQIIDKLGQSIKDKKYDEGYKLFGNTFQGRITAQRFGERMSVYHSDQARDLWGNFQSFKWNGHTEFQKDERTGDLLATTVALGYFEKSGNDPLRINMLARKSGGGWLIENLDIFNTEQQAPPRGAAAPSAVPAGPAGPPAP